MPHHREHFGDVFVSPLPEICGFFFVRLQDRSLTQQLDRQLRHSGSLRSLHGIAAVLAHEIRDPLAGIRGAAELLEASVQDGERELTQVICSEADRINALLDRIEILVDSSAMSRSPVNIHEVLDRVRRVAESSFARRARFVAAFDPSLPAVPGDRDELMRLFINVVRNASDAAPDPGGEIMLATR